MQRLIESFSVNKNTVRELPLTETVFTEKSTGKVYEAKKKYRVDVSQFTLNLNERIYPKSLWENVINNQKHIWEGSFALADHPIEEGSFKDVMGVWSNLHINEETQKARADITFVGENGKKAQEILEAGGKIGFSSSGFGDLKEDGKTVDESTYQIERVADVVLNPSQQVFGTIQDAIEENISIKKEPLLKETTKMATQKMSKFEERRMNDDVIKYLEKAKLSTNLTERLTSLTEIHDSLDDCFSEATRLLVENEIVATTKEIEKATENIASLHETFGTSNTNDIKEGLSKLAIDASLYERQVSDWKKLTETLQVRIIEMQNTIDALPTEEKYQEALEEIEQLKQYAIMKEKSFIAKLESREANLDTNAVLYHEMVKDLQKLGEKNKNLENIRLKYKEKVSLLMKENEGIVEQLTLQKKKFDKMVEKFTAPPVIRKPVQGKEMFKGYNESTEVNAYYTDLSKRHGKEISPYKERILGCKTLFEAMRVYNEALVHMSNTLYTPDTGDFFENKKLVEEATGRHITSQNVLSKPEGWE